MGIDDPIPGLAEPDVRDAVLVAERDVEVAEGIEGAAVDADVLAQSFEDEGALVERGFCFSRHCADGQRFIAVTARNASLRGLCCGRKCLSIRYA